MKREALRHPKMLDLAARLNIDRARAIGIVQLLWDFTVDYATAGDIGKWPNGAIARACEWTSEDVSDEQFVAALVGAGWLDADSQFRLIVHDWPVHCERYVRSKLTSQGAWFLSVYGLEKTPSGDTSGDVSRDTSGDTPRDRTEPNQTKPLVDIEGNDQKDLRETISRVHDSLVRRLKPKTAGDNLLIWRSAYLSQTLYSENWLEDSIAATAAKKARKPFAYFTKCLRTKADGLGRNFDEDCKRVPPKPREADVGDAPSTNGQVTVRLKTA